jgi:hypothetical protein
MDIALPDACAARDVLAYDPVQRQMTRKQQQLDAVRVTGGPGTGALPPACMDVLSHSVHQAGDYLLSIMRSAADAERLRGPG